MTSNEPVWHSEAIQEAEEAREWYAERSEAAARGFLLALDRAVQSILEAPERWPLDRFGCRRYPFTNRYPFTLIYRLRRDLRDLEVVAVAHQKRRPGYWSER